MMLLPLLRRMTASLLLVSCATTSALAETVTITVNDAATKKPVPCRVHLRDESGRPAVTKSLPAWNDHFVCPGTAKLDLAAGEYTFEIERGPEYRQAAGKFTVTQGSSASVSAEISRITDLAAVGWWSGELHVHRPVEEVELLMQAEDLHVAPVITWWNNRNLWKDKPLPTELLVRFDGNRFYHLMAGEDEREGGALMYYNLRKPLDIVGATREYPSPILFLEQAHNDPGVWIDVEKPFWWDVPIWLATGMVDSIGLANNHMCRSRMYESEAWGKPRDEQRLPAPRGNGFWTQELYYKVLDSGLRIPPSAGSASGVLPNPVGYNRVYVHLDGELTYDSWWEGLRAGRSFVTNGPLLQVKADGELPGHIFSAAVGAELTIPLSVNIEGRDDLATVEVVQNGKVVHSQPIEGQAFSGDLPELKFDSSGWFLVRVLCENPRTFRFASTAPFYVEVGENQRRISKAAAQFFLNWVNEREARVKLSDSQMLREVTQHHKSARRFWQAKLTAANAD